MKYLIPFLIFLGACSAEWHIKQAVRKNPSLTDSTKFVKVVVIHDTLYDTVYVPSHKFEVNNIDGLTDSLTLLFSDSFVELYGKIDSLGLSLKGKVKERLIPYTVYDVDTVIVETKCPPNVTVVEGYPKWYLWVVLGIFALILLICLPKRK